VFRAKGPESEEIVIGFRFEGADSHDADCLTLIDKVLFNHTAGLIDLNLNQQQRVLDAGSMLVLMKDYSAHILSAKPREGQSLEEVSALLLEQLELLKKGEFPDWLLEAAINDLKIEQLKLYEHNRGRVEAYVDSFIWGMDWERYNGQIERLHHITKKQLTDFAKKYYGSNFVAVYKEHGKEKSEPGIEKPPITPLKVNRDTLSTFAGELLAMPSKEIAPHFLDYQKDIAFHNINPHIPLHYLQNSENDLYSLYYVFDIGKNQSKKIELALDYLSYLGSSKLSPEEFSRELYKIGATFSAFTSENFVYLKLSGLHERFPEALQLLETLLSDARPDSEALAKLKAGILKERTDDKLSKRKILFEAMTSFGKYGPSSPFTNVLEDGELKAISPEELIDEVKNLMQYRHRVLYYGPATAAELTEELKRVRHYPETPLDPPATDPFVEQEQDGNTIYLVDYDMTQAEVIMLTRDDIYNPAEVPLIALFNEYYGGGMSSVVFQELREAKALAYSVLSIYRTPKQKDKHSYIFSYIGTQADKLPEALEGISELMKRLPESPELFLSAKNGILQKISTERLTRTEVLFSYEEAKRLGINHDIRKDVFKGAQSMTLDDIKAFHRDHFKNRNFVMLVLGNKEQLDLKTLQKYGSIKELSLETIFGY